MRSRARPLSPQKSTALQRCVPTVFQWEPRSVWTPPPRSGLSRQGAETGLRSGLRSHTLLLLLVPESSAWPVRTGAPAVALTRKRKRADALAQRLLVVHFKRLARL